MYPSLLNAFMFVRNFSNKSDESSVMSGGCGGENINMTLLSHNSSVYFVKIVQKDLCVVCKTMETWSRLSYLAII